MPGLPTFAHQQSEWRRVPVDDEGYVASSDLMQLSDGDLSGVILRMEKTRYEGWRNWNNHWRAWLHDSIPPNSRVIDYGCGVGLEALSLSRLGHKVTVADINVQSALLASRVCALFGFSVDWEVINRLGVVDQRRRFDVFYCNGVLHHIPNPRLTMRHAKAMLRQNGEARLMVYSDLAWSRIVGTDPPPHSHEALPGEFDRFVRAMDQVGDYADWYNREKLEREFGDLFDVTFCDYLDDRQLYLAAHLRARD